MDAFLYGPQAKVVCRAIRHSALHAAACQQCREAVHVVIAALIHSELAGALNHRRTAEFAADDEHRLVEETSRFQIFQQRCDGRVRFPRQSFVRSNVFVAVPRLRVAEVHLYHANAALHHPPRQ